MRQTNMIWLLLLLGWCVAHTGLMAQPAVPDLTKGETPTPLKKSKKILEGNLGPTGLMGWMYHHNKGTSLSRQILVTEVDKGSPSDGIVQKGDVILGANGNGNTPQPFTSDARRSFAKAIAEAEARDPATLQMIIWRKGQTSITAITLETMGAYHEFSPYRCRKTLNVILKGLKYLEDHETGKDRFGMNILTFLACNDDRIPGNAERMKRTRDRIIEMLPSKEMVQSMTSDKVETLSKIAWNRSYHLIVFAEYYLATGDNPSKSGVDLLTAIDAHAQTVARGQSMFGTMGHQFALQGADGSTHGPYGVGYGPINATGLASFLGLTLARDCNLPNPQTRAQIDDGIKRASSFFGSYVDRGTIPYGEHPPWTGSHCSNGKSGLAAMAFSRVPGHEEATAFFSKLAIASGSERIGGHGGGFFNYTWTPIGANAGGDEAAAAYFRQISWHLDLARTWEGAFYYNDYGSPGYSGKTFGKASLYMSSPALLTYAFPMRKLIITGRDAKPSNHLTAIGVAEARLASNYNPNRRSPTELLSDLASFSYVVRTKAAMTLAKHADAAAMLPKLHAIAVDKKHPSRRGVIEAIGEIGNPDSATALKQLFDDNEPNIREAAVVAFGKMPPEIRVEEVDTLLKMAASLKRPPMVVNKDDPVNTTLVSLTDVLFDNKKSILGGNIGPVNKYSSREQLYEAVRAIATLPSGGMRGKLKFVFQQMSFNDVKAIAPTLLDLVYVEAPADAMFAEGIRTGALKLLLQHKTEEGVKASVELFKVGGRWTRVVIIKEWADLGPSLLTCKEGPEILEYLRNYGDSKYKDEAKKALKAITDQSKPKVTFTRLL